MGGLFTHSSPVAFSTVPNRVISTVPSGKRSDLQLSAMAFTKVVQATVWAAAQGLKPDLILGEYVALEAPLFHGGGEYGVGRGEADSSFSLRSRVGMTRLKCCLLIYTTDIYLLGEAPHA
jgi:hypothetical protein